MQCAVLLTGQLSLSRHGESTGFDDPGVFARHKISGVGLEFVAIANQQLHQPGM